MTERSTWTSSEMAQSLEVPLRTIGYWRDLGLLGEVERKGSMVLYRPDALWWGLAVKRARDRGVVVSELSATSVELMAERLREEERSGAGAGAAK